MAGRAKVTYSLLCVLAGGLLAVLYVAAPTFQAFFVLPAINDITTDLGDPPAFAVLDAPPYPAEYADRQRAGYPDLGPLVMDWPEQAVFDRARAAALDMGWVIRAEDPAQGRIEAVATTRVLRFKDDIVVRIRGEGAATRVDVRSRSRVGQHDFGANAGRIRAFLARINR